MGSFCGLFAPALKLRPEGESLPRSIRLSPAERAHRSRSHVGDFGGRLTPSLKPRERERGAVAASALDELPNRLAGQGSEGFARELPHEDEDQQGAHRPGQNGQPEHALEPAGHRAERMSRHGGRAETDGRGVSGPVLPHREVEAAVADQQERRRHAQGPPDGRRSREGEGRRRPEGEPVRERAAGAEDAEEGQRYTVVAGALEELHTRCPASGRRHAV